MTNSLGLQKRDLATFSRTSQTNCSLITRLRNVSQNATHLFLNISLCANSISNFCSSPNAWVIRFISLFIFFCSRRISWTESLPYPFHVPREQTFLISASPLVCTTTCWQYPPPPPFGFRRTNWKDNVFHDTQTYDNCRSLQTYRNNSWMAYSTRC